MYNLRRDKKLTKNFNKSKRKNISDTANMQTNNSQVLNVAADGLSNTPINKRLRDVHRHSAAGLSHSSIVDSPFKLLNCLENRFDKFTELILETIDMKFEQFKNDLLGDLREKYKALEDKVHAIDERVTNLETTLGEAKKMQEEIKILKIKLKRQENYPVLSELRLNDIPFSEDENLVNIFHNICTTINTPVPNLKSIYRQKRPNNEHGSISKDAVIIVKFCSIYDRNYFLKSLANFRKRNKGFIFRLRDIGFNSDNKFYLNENLTLSNFKILRAATRLKKKKLIHTVFTRRGFVYIKEKVDGDPVFIDEIECLKRLFPNLEEQAANSGYDA